MLTPRLGARAFIPVPLAGAVLFTLAPTGAAPVAAAGPKTEARGSSDLREQLGDPWRYGATGPSAFDCSGLVIYSYKRAGGPQGHRRRKLRSARALYKYFKAKGLADRKNPKPGDLVIWGGRTHVGIYIGKGTISTLTNGVRIHKVHAVTAKFTAYLHTGMWKKATDGTTIGSAAAARAGDHRRPGHHAARPLRHRLRQPAHGRGVENRDRGPPRWHPVVVPARPRTAGAPGSTSVPANGSAGSPAG